MAKVLVTGGSGFIGSALVRALGRRGEEVTVLARMSSDLSNLEGLNVRIVHGDVCHPPSLRDAMRGAEIVYHAASLYQFFPWWKRKVAPIYKINIKGTRNVLDAARREGVRRFVYTSSIITMGRARDGELSDESMSLAPEQGTSHYARTKTRAEQLVLEEARKGLPAVVVNPGMVFGEGDRKPTPSGEPILKFLNRIYPGYFQTIWSVADVDDVAEAHIAACERGGAGERYILCNKRHYSMGEIFKLLEKISGVRAPRVKFPHPLLWAFVCLDEGSMKWIDHRPILPSEGVRFCRLNLRGDNSKAVRELGYRETPMEVTLEKAVRWFRDHGRVPPIYSQRSMIYARGS